MSKKCNKDKKILTEHGVDGALMLGFYDDLFKIQFEFYDNLIGDCETFSEVTLLEYVANSYEKSCLTLFKCVDEYDLDKSINFNKNCSYRFLPAMFCFRHYVELKLKCLYMIINNRSFENEHDLEKLLKPIKDEGIDCKGFKKAINLINNYEKNDTSFFRYLIDTNFECVKEINVKIHIFNEIKSIINEITIEYREIRKTFRFSKKKDLIN